MNMLKHADTWAGNEGNAPGHALGSDFTAQESRYIFAVSPPVLPEGELYSGSGCSADLAHQRHNW